MYSSKMGMALKGRGEDPWLTSLITVRRLYASISAPVADERGTTGTLPLPG